MKKYSSGAHRSFQEMSFTDKQLRYEAGHDECNTERGHEGHTEEEVLSARVRGEGQGYTGEKMTPEMGFENQEEYEQVLGVRNEQTVGERECHQQKHGGKHHREYLGHTESLVCPEYSDQMRKGSQEGKLYPELKKNAMLT